MNSTLRFLVDEALENRDTTLQEFVETGRDNGKNLKTITNDLAYATGIPVSWRTIYRWTRIP
ncbi:hypothetical protein LCGC14_2425130 [marine sediment metagenome]|uniref:Uncharacterized protein n=1 Tax=marine sediment metagenome TaxID=412755 RepID=A0A0F9EHP2_9ZZZZ